MKKLILLSFLIFATASFTFAQAKSDFTFSLGGSVQYESPILAGGSYNDEFAAANKEVGIDDFLIGMEFRTDWLWDKVGLRLSLMTFYNPTGDYTALGNAFEEIVGSFDTTPLEEIEHGLKFVFNPMFMFKYKFVGFSFGPGAIFSWNVSQGAGAIEAMNSGDYSAISPYIDRIGLDPASYTAVTTTDALRENLTFAQQVAFYGGELDFNLKFALDFYIGKISLTVNYIWDFNTNLALWEEGGDFSTNMSNIFNLEESKGYLGASVLYSF
ncbi:MAG: hypothetical protein JXR63_00975 [Spirochaetales bacterium]|nr:hypothetical protein [Spirochaetales bacterium]